MSVEEYGKRWESLSIMDLENSTRVKPVLLLTQVEHGHTDGTYHCHHEFTVRALGTRRQRAAYAAK